MKCNDFTGVPVILHTTGKAVGVVADLVISLGDGRVTGFLVRSGTVIKRLRFLPTSQVISATVYGITIASAAVLCPFDTARGSRWQADFKGKRVYDISGRGLGSIYNMELSDSLTHISRVVVTDGIAQDMTGGRRTLSTDELCKWKNGYRERSKQT